MLLGSVALCTRIKKPLKEQKVLVVHNIKSFETTHLDMLRFLGDTFHKLYIFSTKSVKTRLIVRGESKYDLVLVLCPTHKNVNQLMHSLGLFEFFDRGGSVLIFGSSHPSGQFRKTLNEFGFDVTSSDNSSEVNRNEVKRRYISVRQRREDAWVKLRSEDFLLAGLDRGLRDGVYYKGSSVNLTIYANDFSWPLVASPQKSFHHFLPLDVNRAKFEFGIKRKILDPERSSVLVGAQKEDVNARVAVFGGVEVFSNEAILKSRGQNLGLLANLVKWLQFETHVLHVQYFRICGKGASSDHIERHDFKDQIKKKKSVYFDYDSDKSGTDFLASKA